MKRTLLLLVSLAITVGVWADGLVYKPNLKSPADSAIYQVPNVTVSWYAITGSLTLQYELQIDTTPLFNSALRVDTTQTLITGYTAHELLFGKVYYWRVRAIDLGQTSIWSAVRQFTVFNKPVLSTPTNGQPGQVPNVAIVWKNTVTTGDGAATLTGYRYWDYQLAADSNFTTPLFQGSTLPAVLKFTTSNLSFGVIYYWRVRARHNLSTSGWSSTFKFTVTNTIALTSPTDNGANQMLDVLLKWTNITGLVGYQVEMASDAAFSNILLSNDVDTSFYRTSSLMFNTKYYWRVRGRHMYDSTGWSNPRSFTTVATVALKTPSDAATDIALKPTFQWNAITTIVGYQLQVDSINTFPTPTIDVRPSYKDVTYTSNKKLRPLTTYYWRMRAFSDGGVTADTTDWSTPRSFITNNSTGIDENFSTSVGIYPNPASEKVFVRIEMTESLTAQLTLVDLLGKIVISRELNLTSGHNIKEIPLDNLNKGIYILRLTMNGHTTNQKLIVEK